MKNVCHSCQIMTVHPFLDEVSAQRQGLWQSHLTEAIAEPLKLTFVCTWECFQRDAAPLVDQYSNCKVHVNCQRKRGPRQLKTSWQSEIKLLQWIATLVSRLYCDYPHLLGCCVSLNAGWHQAIDVYLLIFSHQLSCQKCHDSLAGPDVGWSVAGVEFLLYNSNFVVHHLKLKARQNCHCHLTTGPKSDVQWAKKWRMRGWKVTYWTKCNIGVL